MIKLTQEHIEALLDKFGGEHNPPSIYLEVSLWTNVARSLVCYLSYMKHPVLKVRIPVIRVYLPCGLET